MKNEVTTKMKKIIAWMLAVMMTFGAVAAFAEGAAQDDGMTTIASFEMVEDTIGIQEGTELVVGTTTTISGYLGTDMWGNNTADMDVRALLQGYSIVAYTRTRGLAIDGMAVTSITTETGTDDRTYVITIREGLTYNDGTPITAKDYVFSLLLSGAPVVGELGGMPRGLNHLIGFDAYQAQETNVLSGVRLLSDSSFSLTISNDYLPYFYGMAMLNVTPYPYTVIAPGCDILDDGQGVYVGAAANADSLNAEELGFTPGEFGAEMLAITLLDEETGYVYNPRVTSGPYSLESFDRENEEITFVVNRNYQGNYEGQKPHIERLVLRFARNDTMLEELTNGDAGLLNKVINSDVIDEGTQLANTEDSGVEMDNYARTGFAFLAFACEEEAGATASTAVRQAIARCIDKESLVSKSVGRYGLVVNGYYGLGQWMITQVMPEDTANGLEAVDVPAAMATWETPYDLSEAKDLLIEDGWVLNENGEDFLEGTDTVRYRDNDGTLEPLLVKWAKNSESAVAEEIEALIEGPFAELGIALEIDEMSFTDMLEYYYRLKDRTYNMFFLSSNFTYLFDPYFDYNVADEYQGLVNTSGLQDEELMTLARDMRETAPSDLQQYLLRWQGFQERWVEMMPMVPLYSNTYFDFYRSDLQDYEITQYPGWAYAVVYAWIGEPVEEEDAGAGEATEPVTEPDYEGDGTEVLTVDDLLELEQGGSESEGETTGEE